MRFPFKRLKWICPPARLHARQGRGIWRFAYLRQTLLFLFAVVLPSSTLIVLSFRVIAQERELEAKRGRERREQAAREFGAELSRGLEGIARAVVGLTPGEIQEGRWKEASRDLDLAAVVINDQLLLPWAHYSQTEQVEKRLQQSPFGDLFQRGQRQEFEEQDLPSALAKYRQAKEMAALPIQAAYSSLAEVRVLSKLNAPVATRTHGHDLLQLPWTLRDEFGIPLAFYAAGHLIGGVETLAEVLNLITQAADAWFLPPPALYMAQDYLAQLKPRLPNQMEAIAKLSQQIRDQLSWQAEWDELKTELHILRADLSRDARVGGNEHRWALYGREPSLVCLAALRSAPGELFLAVRARPLCERAAQAIGPGASHSASGETWDGRLQPEIIRGPHPEGLWLGESFPNLQVIFAASGFSTPLTGPRHLYLALISMVVGITLFAAYLWWRDTRRELRLAEMRSDFVSSVSHELKTPLTSVQMLAETMLLRDLGTRERREYLDLILTESERLGRLLKNVLDFASVEKGTKRYQMESVELEPILAAAVRCIQHPLREKHLELHVSGSGRNLILRADSDALEQALLNLLHNAMKYSHQDGRIELEAAYAGQEARIQVRDYGVGIHPSDQQRIFEHFYRSPEEHNRRIPGTGLGLALVQHIIDAHGGRVTVQSAPGQGSTFTLHLPLEFNRG